MSIFPSLWIKKNLILFFVSSVLLFFSVPGVLWAFQHYSEGQLANHIVLFVEDKMDTYGNARLLPALTYLEQLQVLNPENKRMYRVLWTVVETLSEQYDIFYDLENTVLSVNTIRTSSSWWTDIKVHIELDDKETQPKAQIEVQEKEEKNDNSTVDTEWDKWTIHEEVTKNWPKKWWIWDKKVIDESNNTTNEAANQTKKEILWTSTSSQGASSDIKKYEKKSGSYHLDRVVPYDADFIAEERLRWVNILRKGQWVDLLELDSTYTLRNTATERAVDLKKKQNADHLRSEQKCVNPSSNNYCYDYPKMVERFDERWVTFTNVNRATFTENIWRARYSCTDDECTDEVLASIRHVFDYFASEQTYEWVHWRTMIQKNFEIVWVWVAIDKEFWKAYVVAHYWTQLK